MGCRRQWRKRYSDACRIHACNTSTWRTRTQTLELLVCSFAARTNPQRTPLPPSFPLRRALPRRRHHRPDSAVKQPPLRSRQPLPVGQPETCAPSTPQLLSASTHTVCSTPCVTSQRGTYLKSRLLGPRPEHGTDPPELPSHRVGKQQKHDGKGARPTEDATTTKNLIQDLALGGTEKVLPDGGSKLPSD